MTVNTEFRLPWRPILAIVISIAVLIWYIVYSNPNLSSLFIIVAEFALIIVLWHMVPRVRNLVGEDKNKSYIGGGTVQHVLFMFLFAPFTIYFIFVLGGQKQIAASDPFNIVTVAPVLSSLVLTAASVYGRDSAKSLDFIRVSQKFILATVFFIVFAPIFFMLNLLNGIDLVFNCSNLLDPVAWGRGLYFWTAVPCFFLGIILFMWGLWDLALLLSNIHDDMEKEIRSISYKLWEDDGHPNGRDLDNWLRAEAIWKSRNKKHSCKTMWKHDRT